MTSPAPKISPFSTDEKIPPLGIGYLLSVLKNNGHTVYFSDEYLKPSRILDSNFLFKNNIDYVGVYSNTICFQGTLILLEKLKKAREKGWKGAIMVGGPHTCVNVEDFPEYVDYIVVGEGERAIVEIIEGQVNERVIIGKKVEDLDTLPRPAWEIFSKLPYNWEHYWIKDKPIFTLNTSRGCPFNCTFCSVRNIWGKTYRIMSGKRIFEDVSYLVKTYSAKGIYFREDNFTLNKKRVIEFCNLLMENNVNISWICETRADSLQDFEYVSLMANSGCKAFYIGVESGSPHMLELINKQISRKQIIKAFENAHKVKIKTYASLIYGLPYETDEDLRLTNSLIIKIKPNFIGRNIFVGIPGSELYDYVKKNKLYEFKDKNGLLYLKDHNDRVNKYYHGSPYSKVPGTASSYEFVIFDLKRILRQFLIKVRDWLNITNNFKFQNKISELLIKLIS
jgi:radical SAM superfamily enzyme YgiQ (UPF0313 family)